MTELICIVCPKGCHLKVEEEHDFHVTGNSCPRGEDYGKAELQNPVRVITSTVKISGGIHRRLPVKTTGAIPKSLIFEAMKTLDEIEMVSPVALGQIIVKNVCKTGIDFVSTREM